VGASPANLFISSSLDVTSLLFGGHTITR
jgi:hypothetical protein